MSAAEDARRSGGPPAYADLGLVDDNLEHFQVFGLLLKTLHFRKRILFVVGAGISVSCGVPVFRSSDGLFSSGRFLFERTVYADANSRRRFHEMISNLSRQCAAAKPSPFHRMLATLAGEGRLLRLYTQNIDSLETKFSELAVQTPLRQLEDGRWPVTIQLHGDVTKMQCGKCYHVSDLDPTIFAGSEPPQCRMCVALESFRVDTLGKRSHGVGHLRPRVQLYGEAGIDDDAIQAVMKHDHKQIPDAVVVVGTGLEVPGAKNLVADMCRVMKASNGGPSVWINPDVSRAAKIGIQWDLVVGGSADEVACRSGMTMTDPVRA